MGAFRPWVLMISVTIAALSVVSWLGSQWTSVDRSLLAMGAHASPLAASSRETGGSEVRYDPHEDECQENQPTPTADYPDGVIADWRKMVEPPAQFQFSRLAEVSTTLKNGVAVKSALHRGSSGAWMFRIEICLGASTLERTALDLRWPAYLRQLAVEDTDLLEGAEWICLRATADPNCRVRLAAIQRIDSVRDMAVAAQALSDPCYLVVIEAMRQIVSAFDFKDPETDAAFRVGFSYRGSGRPPYGLIRRQAARVARSVVRIDNRLIGRAQLEKIERLATLAQE